MKTHKNVSSFNCALILAKLFLTSADISALFLAEKYGSELGIIPNLV